MKRTIAKPKYGAGREWPDGKTVTIEKVSTGAYVDTYDVAIDGEVVGQIERSANRHAIPIRGSRLIRGRTKPRVEWRPKDRRTPGLWDETAGMAIGYMLARQAKS